jgi:hypothetical protein
MPTGSGNDRANVEVETTSLRGRITTVALVAMVALNFYLVNQNRQLAAALLSEQGVRRSVTEVAAGRVLPPLTGRNLEGKPVSFAYGVDNRSTLILVFSSMCPVCEENWPAWSRILARVDTGRVRIAAVDLLSGAPDSYLSRHGIKVDWVIRNVEAASLTSYKFSLTPQTLVVDSRGRVEHVWTGPLSVADLITIETSLGNSSGTVSGTPPAAADNPLVRANE